MAINKYTFEDSDLTGGYLEYTHNLNTEDVIPFLTDNDGKSIIINDIFWLGDISNSNLANVVTIDLNAFGTITGTWKLLLSYTATQEASTGVKAFELTTETPTDDYRLILGKALTPEINITLTNFFALLLTKLGFLKKASNLSDLNNVTTARTNLGVYSTAQVNSALANKATLLQSGSGAVLGIANTASSFTPTSNYHPATKIYTDKTILLIARIDSGVNPTIAILCNKIGGTPSVARTNAGRYVITHNYNSIKYFCWGIGYGTGSENTFLPPVLIHTLTINSVGVLIGGSIGMVDQDFYFYMLRIPV